MAEAASAHAVDEEYDSPYMQLARQQGLDLPWWQKVRSASFNDGKFSLGGLKVCAYQWLHVQAWEGLRVLIWEALLAWCGPLPAAICQGC